MDDDKNVHTDDDDYEDEDIVPVLAALGIFKRSSVPCISQFADEVVNQYTEWDFKYHFRLNRTYNILCNELRHALEPDNPRGKLTIPYTKQVLIFL